MFENRDGLLTAGDLSKEESHRLLAAVGFDDPASAGERLASLCADEDDRRSFAPCLPALLHALSSSASPDASLINFERFVQSVPRRSELFGYLAENPRAVEILVKLFVGSQFLTEILLRNPEYLERLTLHRRLSEFKHRDQMTEEARAATGEGTTTAERLDRLRRFQKWELLRLGACDAFGLMDLKTVTLQLALLADSIVQVSLDLIAEDLHLDTSNFAVLAFGKLGGEELNYSSDIDLVFVTETGAERYWPLGQRLIKALMESTSEGFLYRVDMRLRPWGKSGPLVSNASAYVDYLRRHGRLWEKQALLKARCIAGNHAIGNELLKSLQPTLFDITPAEVRESVRSMKAKIEDQLEQQGRGWGEVKAGQGSIRDIEFLTQALQLIHGREKPAVRSINTLDGLVRLADLDFIHAQDYRQLTTGYIFLRTIEHSLQLMHNKQMHSLPQDRRELAYLARRLDYPGPDEFVAQYERHCFEIRRIYTRYLLDEPEQEEEVGVDAGRNVSLHLGASATSYQDLFDGPTVARHVQLLERLGHDREVCIDARTSGDDRCELTIVGYDHLGELSLMCGLLFVYGYNIDAGHVFTGDEVPSTRSRPGSGERLRKYVNVFYLKTADGAVSDSNWRHYEAELSQLVGLLKLGQRGEAQGRMAKRVAAALAPSTPTAPPLLPVEIDIDNEADPTATVLEIRGGDTVGFLYELTNALSLTGISIDRMQIHSAGREVVDTLHVTDVHGRKITDLQRQLEIRAAIVLIKHFTHLLPSSPNPEAALLHFGELTEQLFRQPGWIDSLSRLQQSDVLNALVQLLGVSDFLWHDFLKLQHANLFPVVTDLAALQEQRTKGDLEQSLDKELSQTADLNARRDILNAFKDREMLRVDMRHILGLQDKFGMFSGELTDVAEVVVEAAYRICDEALRKRHGDPQNEHGDDSPLTICALGKCGGRELGFASDIELMFLYEQDGMTTGPERVTNLEYYQLIVEAFRKSIRARRQGIFEIDLRLRPYGKAGSLAISQETFEKYFAPDGPAWPYERQALVKLRPIAGDLKFGKRIVGLRDTVVYSGRPFDVASMRAMREKQQRQLVKPGTFNAKLSPGGLVDCEYLVQGLQITHGHKHKGLRVPNTREALKGLQKIGVITPTERVSLRDAYRFLRRLIDALRMVRGDARDLTVPPVDTEQFQFLARRLGYLKAPLKLQQDIEFHTANVRELSRLMDR